MPDPKRPGKFASLTAPTQVVLGALLDELGRERCVSELCAMTGLAFTTVSQMLRRLERDGWVRSRREADADRQHQGKPRRYYTINPDQAPALCDALLERQTRVSAAVSTRTYRVGEPVWWTDPARPQLGTIPGWVVEYLDGGQLYRVAWLPGEGGGVNALERDLEAREGPPPTAGFVAACRAASSEE